VTTIDRHGAAIDADLHSEFGGLCLLDWFRGTYSWKHLFRLLGQLGTDSRWFKAQLMDPEVAGAWAKDALEREKKANAEGREPAPWRPPLADYTLTDELIVALINEIRGLRFQMSTASATWIRSRGRTPSSTGSSPRSASSRKTSTWTA